MTINGKRSFISNVFPMGFWFGKYTSACDFEITMLNGASNALFRSPSISLILKTLKKELWITEEETDNLSQCVIVFPADLDLSGRIETKQ